MLRVGSGPQKIDDITASTDTYYVRICTSATMLIHHCAMRRDDGTRSGTAVWSKSAPVLSDFGCGPHSSPPMRDSIQVSHSARARTGSASVAKGG
jgi:hypothetical protein